MKNNKYYGIIGVAFLFCFCGMGIWLFFTQQNRVFSSSQQPLVTVHAPTPFQMQGVPGKDALTLLKEHAQIQQDASGLVISINGRKADVKKHEYWTFFINGKMASVGPAAYQTQKIDSIIWKIGTY
jgi:hypothetical protein